MHPAPIDTLPGFRRRFIVTPAPDRVSSEVEDDYHCMGVTIHHDGKLATEVKSVMQRAPWTTCPGAIGRLEQTFTGVPLADFAARGEKRTNCTLGNHSRAWTHHCLGQATGLAPPACRQLLHLPTRKNRRGQASRGDPRFQPGPGTARGAAARAMITSESNP